MKKAFTLAEILIVLTIIGIMAVMTIPSLLQNANSQHKIALFKKGFNAISNAYATEFATKTPPKSTYDGEKMWDALNNQLNVKYYVNAENGQKIFSKNDAKSVVFYKCVIVTEDGLGYRVGYTSSKNCPSKLQVNSVTKTETVFSEVSCLDVAIILDNKYKSSQRRDCHINPYAGDSASLDNLNCNMLWVHITTDGITSGNPDCTIAGRIMSDNETYDCNKCGSCS